MPSPCLIGKHAAQHGTDSASNGGNGAEQQPIFGGEADILVTIKEGECSNPVKSEANKPATEVKGMKACSAEKQCGCREVAKLDCLRPTIDCVHTHHCRQPLNP